MKLQHIYKADINRNINGVIKVAQDDEQSIEQELREYIITKELRKHFHTFYNHYESSLNEPTDKIGVWISGFFGSGKSHFLKILSYLLSNDVVAGKHSVDFFSDKFDDPFMFAQIERCASIPTDTILFNIDSKSPINKDKTAILRVFAKVFYEHRGFYGDDLKVAKLEQFVERSQKTEEFRQRFQEINGSKWEDARDAFAFFEDDVVEVLKDVLDMSETSARNWFTGAETAELSIEQLVQEIKEYVDSKGKDYRLVFLIDEVGQYIGSDSDLMLNLQTIVEDIGANCNGQVWVMVTSQEAIDQITTIIGDDFSKIQGRFNTRLSLSSSSVDEVIKKRILAKNENAEQLLKHSYSKNSAVLKNLYTFVHSVSDLGGFANETEFVETYPFIPYQFRLMQDVLVQIRKHGTSGKHLSGGERSMLSGFQETAQAIQEKDENALVPFDLFYDTIHTFLDSAIRRVIDRCQDAADNNHGIEQYDVRVLKLLYMIRYIDDVKANKENITTLMVEDIRADKIIMREKVQASLDRLRSQNYIALYGDNYLFLTDDEQDIAREINNTTVDSSNIIRSISNIIFGELYTYKKFRLGKVDFSFDPFVDEQAASNISGGVRLYVLTEASDYITKENEQLIMRSHSQNEAFVILSDEYKYFEELEQAGKIRKYVKSQNITSLSEPIQDIIRARQQQATNHEKRAKELIEKSILNAKIIVAGEVYPYKPSTVKDTLDIALQNLVEYVYNKQHYIEKHFEDDTDLIKILEKQHQAYDFDGSLKEDNLDAVREIEQYLSLQEQKMLPTSMADIQSRFSSIPYGWREIDIAAAVATLIAHQKIVLQYSGSMIQSTDPKLPDYLRRKSDINKSLIKRKVAIPDLLKKNSREFLRKYFHLMDVPSDDDDLISFVVDKFEKQKEHLQHLLESEYRTENYPDKEIVENGVRDINTLLSESKDHTAFLTKLIDMRYQFEDLSDDIIEVNEFFKIQKPIFDNASHLLSDLQSEKHYLDGKSDALNAIARISQIIKSPKPYKNISELPDLIREVKTIYEELLALKKEEVYTEIRAAMGEIHQTATPKQEDIVQRADEALRRQEDETSNARTLTTLDAKKMQINHLRQQYLKELVIEEDPQIKVITIPRSTIPYVAKLTNEAEVDEYVEDIKKDLKAKLEGNDVLQII